jgi:uncharacterized protein
MEAKVLLFFLVTIGSLISSLTGLGGGTLILAGLMLVFPPQLAIPLHSFTQMSANAIRVSLFFKQVHWKVVVAYSSLMIPFAWSGALIFEHINPDVLKIVVGVFILYSLRPLKIKPTEEPKLKTFALLGAASGFLGVFVGAVGPLVTPFFNRLKIGREGSLSTKSAGQFFLQVSKVIAFAGAADFNFNSLKEDIGLLIAGSFLGVMISIPIGKKIPDHIFEKAVNVMLFLIAIKITYEGISNLV